MNFHFNTNNKYIMWVVNFKIKYLKLRKEK